MGFFNTLFGGTGASSTQIADAIKTTERDLATVRTKISAALDGLATFTDEQHVAAEAKQAELKRTEARLVARIEALTADLATVQAAEDQAERAAEEAAFVARVKAARNAATNESLKHLRDYQKAASQVAASLAALDAIQLETDAVNAEIRKRGGREELIPSYDTLHRKASDRPASVRKERCKVWVATDPHDGTETIQPATFDANGEVIPIAQPLPFNRQGYRQAMYRLEEREIVVGNTSFRPGAYLPSLIHSVILPPALVGQYSIWPRPKKA